MLHCKYTRESKKRKEGQFQFTSGVMVVVLKKMAAINKWNLPSFAPS